MGWEVRMTDRFWERMEREREREREMRERERGKGRGWVGRLE